jgi:hypothetical protein
MIIGHKNDMSAINIGDTVTGTGIPTNAIVASKTTSSITISSINGTWNGITYTSALNTTAIVSSITVTGNTFDLSSDSLEWDSFQGHLFGKNNDYSDRLRGLNVREGAGEAFQQVNLGGTIQSEIGIVSDNINNTPRTSNKTKQRTRRIEYYIRIY